MMWIKKNTTSHCKHFALIRNPRLVIYGNLLVCILCLSRGNGPLRDDGMVKMTLLHRPEIHNNEEER